MTNPSLDLEPFWEPLGDVIEWAADNVTSILCSCLATHALVKHLYGIDREPLPEKLWGVYRHRVVDRTHPLTQDVNTRFDAPHSRWNDIPHASWESAGLRVLAESEQAGVHMATSPDGFRIVYFQGHPEYDRNSLLKEYKREVGRFLDDELESPPPYPEHYLTPESDHLAQTYLRDALAARAHGRTIRSSRRRPSTPTWTTPGGTRAARSSTTGWGWSTSSPASTATSRSCPASIHAIRWASATTTERNAEQEDPPMKDETLAVHAGYETDPTTKSVVPPIYQTVAYEFDDAQHGADLFNLEVAGNIYTRIMNPTADVLEKRVAEMEGGIAGLALSAGSAAINYAVLTIAKAGANIVSVPQLYGGTYTLFAHMLPGQGIDVRFAEDDGPAALEKLIDDKTAAVFLESIGNPAGNIADIEAIAQMAHRHGVPVIVDSTVSTPALTKPIEWGADIVIHSMTKYIGGHGNSLGGMIVDSGNFPWAEHPDRYPMLIEPEPAYHGVSYTETFGPAAFIARARTVPLRNTGSAISPLNAFLILQGIQTLPIRMERHVENAKAVASTSRRTRGSSGSATPACPTRPTTSSRRSTPAASRRGC